jgi:hypothetical protein
MTLETGGFYEFLEGLFMKLPRAYSRRQIDYFLKVFDELNLVYRNTKEFDSQRTRAFMARASNSNEYIIPADDATLNLEWIRTSSGVVNGMAMSVIKRLTSFHKEYELAYKDAISGHSVAESVETAIETHPLTWAVYRSVTHFHELNKSMGYTNDLSKQLESVTLIDLERLKHRERTSIDLVFAYSTLGRKLAFQLKDDPYLIIAKARSMQFGRSLFDIRISMGKAYPNIKLECANI